jgi:hypothetical protein
VKSWAVPAAIIVAIEYLFAFAIGARVGFHYQIPLVGYAIGGFVIAGAGTVVMILAKLFRYARQGEAKPARRLASEIKDFLPFIVGILLITTEIGALTWTKVMLPIVNPFWADPLLARVDHALFLGTDPWMVAHALFGWAAPAIDGCYVTWLPLKLLTTLFVFSMPESERKAQAILSYFLIIVGVEIGQYALPSAGPVFYAQLGYGNRFAQLPIGPWVETTRNYLWHDYLRGGGSIGAGISAMPSLHVAASVWMALVWRSYFRPLGIPGWLYTVVILIGSVLLGWHYAVDGILAVAIAATAWWLASERFGLRLRKVPEEAGAQLPYPTTLARGSGS